MARLRTEALLLRSVDFGESDRITHLLTPHTGRLTAIAKGARRSVKRFGGNLDLFNHLRVDVERRRRMSMARLENAALLHAFLPLRTDPARFGLGCYLVELLDRQAPEGMPPSDARRLFEFAVAALRVLERGHPDARLRVLLELRALDALGLRPEFGRCVRCGRPPEGATAGFRVADGGVVCDACGLREEGVLRVHMGTLRALEQGLRFRIDQLDRLALGPSALAEAQRLVTRFQRFHVGIELRSEPFLDRVLRVPAAPPAPPPEGPAA